MDPVEVMRAELAEALVHMVNVTIANGRADAELALECLDVMRALAARRPNTDDFLTDINAAEWTILKYLAGAQG
jgi:hypothetical protein